jgi:hypothetical protein
MTKSVDTLDELDPFFDGWIRECGWANIAGYSHYAGQLEDRAAMSMAPPKRTPCRRIMERALVLADGRLVLCDQDFTGAYAVGNLHRDGLGAVWGGSAMTQVRQAHLEGAFEVGVWCGRCDEWHRP